MPTYSYECGGCGYVLDVFHGMSAEPTVKCDQCGKKCKRLMGTGAGFIFKGTGFYETDFKDKKGTPPEKAKTPDSAAAKGEGKSETKATPEAKSASDKSKNSSARKKAANN